MNRRFSPDEARQIFASAAERQQARHRDEAATLSLSELEDAGVAAGIDPAFVRAAAADILRPDRKSVSRSFMGIPVELRRTRVLSAAIDEEDWSQIIAHLRTTFGSLGVTNLIGSTKEWSSSSDPNKMPVHLVVESEDDVTRLTIERKTWPMAVGFGSGTLVTLVTGLILGIVWLATGTAEPIWIPSMVLIVFSIMFGMGSWFGVRAHERRDAKRFEAAVNFVAHLADRHAAPSARSEMQDGSDERGGRQSVDLGEELDRQVRDDRGRRRNRS